MRRQTLPESCYTATLNQPLGDRKANRQTDLDRGRQTDRQRYRQAGSQKDRLAEKQTEKDISPINTLVMAVFYDLFIIFKHMPYLQIRLRERFDQIIREHMCRTWTTLCS